MPSAHVEDGFGEVILAALMGALMGLLLGLVLSNVIRYCAFLMGRHQTGHHWTIFSILAGALFFAVWAALGQENGNPAPEPQPLPLD